MKEQELEIIKSRQLFLKVGEKSNEVVLVDKAGGDMFLTFELRYVDNAAIGNTILSTSDPHHADFIIETRPNSITKPSEPIFLGTYENDRPLYMGFVIQPQIAQSGEHEVTITFYRGKEGDDGAIN